MAVETDAERDSHAAIEDVAAVADGGQHVDAMAVVVAAEEEVDYAAATQFLLLSTTRRRQRDRDTGRNGNIESQVTV